jgi:hypothetical protein
LTSERSQVGINLPSIILRHNWFRMNKLHRAAVAAFVAALMISAAHADGSNTSAQGLLSAWKGEDPNVRMVAEVIASAFASGLSWKGTLAGTDVYWPPQGLKGDQVMTALDQFLASNSNFADKTYGDAWRCVPVPGTISRHDASSGGKALTLTRPVHGAKSDLVAGRTDSRSRSLYASP